MKYYEITILSQGRKQVRHLKANNKAEAMNIAQTNLGGMIIRIKEKAMPLNVRLEELKEKLKDKFAKRSINIQEFTVFLKQVSVMTNAGISLRDALFESMTSSEDKLIKEIASTAMEDIEAGLSLTESIKKYEKEVGAITIAMVELGEKTGAISESLNKLTEILEEIQDNRSKMKKATRMPIISMCAMGAAFVTLIMLVVPKFKGIFQKFGAELPPPTKFLLAMEYAFTNFGHLFIVGIFALFYLHKEVYKKNYSYRLKFDKYLLKIYLIGQIYSLAMYGRFMMIFSELIKAGIPLSDALESASITIENAYIKDRLDNVSISIQRGNSLAEAFDDTGLFESMVIQMIKSGESGGELDGMIYKIYQYYRTRFQNIVDNISSLIEPILMGVIAVMVLVLALGIFLPMWELSSAVKK